jgi:hypothetical protein
MSLLVQFVPLVKVETASSHPTGGQQLSYDMLHISHIMSYAVDSDTLSSAEVASTAQDSDPVQIPSPPTPTTEPELSPDTTPTVNTAEPSMSTLTEQNNPPHEHEAMSSHGSARPRIPFIGLDAARAVPETMQSGIQLTTEPAWVPQDSSRIRAHSLPSSPPSTWRVVQLPPVPSSPISASRVAKLRPSPKPFSVFPIMKLPPELRLMIFDEVFLDLTVRRQRFMLCHNEARLSEKHQANDFRPYTNLLLTCKEFNKEAKDRWEKVFLHECCFYFWNVSELYDLSLVLEKLGEPYTGIKYALRSRHDYHGTELAEVFCVSETMADATSYAAETLMKSQPGFSAAELQAFDEAIEMMTTDATMFDPRTTDGLYVTATPTPWKVIFFTPEGPPEDLYSRTFTYAWLSSPETCLISVHQNTPRQDSLCDDERDDHFSQMQGRFSGIFWGGYDALDGYEGFKLWKTSLGNCKTPTTTAEGTTVPKHFHAKGRSILEWWHKARTSDPKWLALGGNPDQSLMDMAMNNNLESWLEEPGERECPIQHQ